MNNSTWWLEDCYWQADMQQVMSSHATFIDKQKITTTVKFHDLTLKVDAGVYHPIDGSSTRLIAESLQDLIPPNATVLDMGSGSGALSFLSVARGAKYAVAADISDIACKCAYQNAHDLNVGHKVTVLKSNLFENIPRQQFDLIVFNPPLLHCEPMGGLEKIDYNLMAIDEQGSLLNQFVESVPAYLKLNGRLVLLISNIGDKQIIQKVMDKISTIGNVEVLSANFRHSGMEWRFLLSVVKSLPQALKPSYSATSETT